MASKLSLQAGAATVILACALCVPVTATAQQISIETGAEGDALTLTASARVEVKLAVVKYPLRRIGLGYKAHPQMP